MTVSPSTKSEVDTFHRLQWGLAVQAHCNARHCPLFLQSLTAGADEPAQYLSCVVHLPASTASSLSQRLERAPSSNLEPLSLLLLSRQDDPSSAPHMMQPPTAGSATKLLHLNTTPLAMEEIIARSPLKQYTFSDEIILVGRGTGHWVSCRPARPDISGTATFVLKGIACIRPSTSDLPRTSADNA